MPTVKVDMTGVDPEESLRNDFTPAPQGVHRAKVISVTPDTSKSSNKPMLVVVVQPVGEDGTVYSQIWSYLTFASEGYAAKKMDQFLLAAGVLTKSKRKASFNPDSLKGKTVKVNVRAKRQDEGTPDEYRGVYQPEVSAFLVDDSDEDLDLNTDGELDTDFDDEEFGENEEADEEETVQLFTDAEIDAMDAAELKGHLAENYEVATKLRKTDALAALLKKTQAKYVEDNGLDDPNAEEGDDEEDEEWGEEDEEDTSEYLTEAQLKEMDNATLRTTMKDFDLNPKDYKTKSAVIKAILEAQAADDEEPF